MKSNSKDNKSKNNKKKINSKDLTAVCKPEAIQMKQKNKMKKEKFKKLGNKNCNKRSITTTLMPMKSWKQLFRISSDCAKI